MKERLTKLLTVKSIVTIILTAVFAYLSVIGWWALTSSLPCLR